MEVDKPTKLQVCKARLSQSGSARRHCLAVPRKMGHGCGVVMIDGHRSRCLGYLRENKGVIIGRLWSEVAGLFRSSPEVGKVVVPLCEESAFCGQGKAERCGITTPPYAAKWLAMLQAQAGVGESLPEKSEYGHAGECRGERYSAVGADN